MLKRILFGTLLCISGALLGADVVAIGNTRGGYPLIVPQVKTLTPADGAFSLPERLVVAAPAELDLAPLAEAWHHAGTGRDIIRANENEDAVCRFELVQSDVPESSEGYTLAVSPDGVLIQSRDIRGLFYGMHSLNWLIRGCGGNEVKCCRITDWPDLEIRGLYLQLSSVHPNRLSRIYHVIDVLASLKYNTLLVSFFDNFPFEDSPFTRRTSTFSKADIADLMAVAKRNHIELIPKLQVISHASWILNHRDWPAFEEGPADRPHSTLYCPLHAETLPLVQRMVRETAEMIRPRYFHLGLDEILLSDYPMCPKCRAADPTRTIIDHVRPVKDMLKEMNIQTIIYHDDYFGSSNPQIEKPVSITQVPEGLGKDIMVNSWEYDASPTRRIGDRIRARGFEDLVYMSFAVNIENCWKLPKIAHELKAKGNFLAYWSIVPPTLDRHDNSQPDFYPSTIAQSNYTWNASDVEFSRLPIDSANLLRELLDGKPESHFRGRPAPVPLSGVCNALIGDDPMFPYLDASLIGKIQAIAAADSARFALTPENGRLPAVVLSGTPMDGRPAGPVKIPVGTTASGASFLVTASAFNNYTLNDKGAAFQIGELTFVYSDGETAKQPLVYQRNINDWNSFIGGNACRAVLRGNDLNDALFSFYAIDWRNPRPEQPIQEIVLSTQGDTMLASTLLAISLSDTGEPPRPEPPARRRRQISARRRRSSFPSPTSRTAFPQAGAMCGRAHRDVTYTPSTIRSAEKCWRS